MSFDCTFKITVMVGREPSHYHVQDKNLLHTGFYHTITIKHTISRERWAISYFSADALWYLGVATFQAVIKTEVIWLCESSEKLTFFSEDNFKVIFEVTFRKKGKVKRNPNDNFMNKSNKQLFQNYNTNTILIKN